MNRLSKVDVPARTVSTGELFLGFPKIGMLGFGGVAPWARHVIVEERKWVSEREFAAVLGVGQVLPGPNTMNAAVILGDRFQGIAGVLACVLGQMLVPLVVVISLATIYGRFAGLAGVNAALAGAAAGATGLVMGTAVKMARKIKPAPLSLFVGAAGFVAVGLLQWPMVPVVVGLVPLGLIAAVMEQRA